MNIYTYEEDTLTKMENEILLLEILHAQELEKFKKRIATSEDAVS